MTVPSLKLPAALLVLPINQNLLKQEHQKKSIYKVLDPSNPEINQ